VSGTIRFHLLPWQLTCKSYFVTTPKQRNYNLDIKNPHEEDIEHADLEEMLTEYQQLMADLGEVRDKLKFELKESLERQS
jgi:type I restriction-modification system DNA methylase subunit